MDGTKPNVSRLLTSDYKSMDGTKPNATLPMAKKKKKKKKNKEEEEEKKRRFSRLSSKKCSGIDSFG